MVFFVDDAAYDALPLAELTVCKRASSACKRRGEWAPSSTTLHHTDEATSESEMGLPCRVIVVLVRPFAWPVS